MKEQKEKFEEWALLELFGHQKIAGKISEQQIGGTSFVRIDVPETDKQPGYTKLFGNGAIYAITITNEETAKKAAEYWGPAPMDKWTIEDVLRRHKALNAPEQPYYEDDDQEDLF